MTRFRIKCPNGELGIYDFAVSVPQDERDDNVLVIVADVPENNGMSSTNCFERIATVLYKTALIGIAPAPGGVQWVQRDTEGHYFSVELNFIQNGNDVEFHTPSWKPLPEEAVVKLLKRALSNAGQSEKREPDPR